MQNEFAGYVAKVGGRPVLYILFLGDSGRNYQFVSRHAQPDNAASAAPCPDLECQVVVRVGILCIHYPRFIHVHSSVRTLSAIR